MKPLLLLALVLLFGCEKTRPSQTYIIPEGTSGWCIVLWQRPKTEIKEPVESDVISFDEYGIAKRSDKPALGWGSDLFFIQKKDGTRYTVPEIIANSAGSVVLKNGETVQYTSFFAGDRAELGKAKSQTGRLEELLDKGGIEVN